MKGDDPKDSVVSPTLKNQSAHDVWQDLLIWLISHGKEMVLLGICGTIIFGYVSFNYRDLWTLLFKYLFITSFSLIWSGIIASYITIVNSNKL